MRRNRLLPVAALAFAACGNDATMMMQPTPETLSISLTPFTLQPGEEKIECYYVPPDGKDKYFNEITVDMAPGSHHLVVMRILDQQGMPAYGPQDCINGEMPNLNTIDGMLPGSQQPHTEYSFPDGVGMRISKDDGLWFQSHYINATNAPITTAVTWKVTLIDQAKVTQQAGLIFWSDYGLKVTPGMSTAGQTCKAPADMSLLTATGHMHRRGIDFLAQTGGQTIFHTTNWAEPSGNLFPAPGFAIKQGDSVQYTCTYQNDSNMTYTFGNSAINNEMCIFPALYYPSANGDTLFFCQQ